MRHNSVVSALCCVLGECWRYYCRDVGGTIAGMLVVLLRGRWWYYCGDVGGSLMVSLGVSVLCGVPFLPLYSGVP